MAILNAVPEAAKLLLCLGGSRTNRIATATLLKAQIVMNSQLSDPGVMELELLVRRAKIQPIPFDTNHLNWALHGRRHYSRGRHKAALNLVDYFSYGLAKALDAPLLFKGEDVHYTDVKVAR